MNITRLQQLLEAVAPAVGGGRCFISGGAVRDLALGLGAPKDVDLVLLAPTDEETRKAVEYLIFLGYRPQMSAGIDVGFDTGRGDPPHWDAAEYTGEGDGAFNQRWRGLVKFTHILTGVELDLLCSYTDDVNTLVGSYDYNINQYVLHLGRMSVDFLGQSQGVLVKLRPDGVCPNRQYRMYQKGIAAGWDVTGAVPDNQQGASNEHVAAALGSDLPSMPPCR